MGLNCTRLTAIVQAEDGMWVGLKLHVCDYSVSMRSHMTSYKKFCDLAAVMWPSKSHDLQSRDNWCIYLGDMLHHV